MKRLIRQNHSSVGAANNSDNNNNNNNSNNNYQHPGNSTSSSYDTPPQLSGLSPAARIRRQHTDTEVNSRTPGRIDTLARSPRSVSSTKNVRTLNGPILDSSAFPSAWNIENPSLRNSDPLCINMNVSPKVAVYADRPLLASALQKGQPERDKWGQRGLLDGSPSALYPSLSQADATISSGGTPRTHSKATQAYYFEVVVVSCAHPSSTPVDIAIGLSCDQQSFGVWPGELPNSIGWGSDGLCINGHCLEPAEKATRHRFRNGDVIGCGIEVSGLYRAFFTYNGTLIVPPSSSTTFCSNKELSCYPVAAFRQGNGDMLKANFGHDVNDPFQWTGNDRLSVHTALAGRLSSMLPSALDSLQYTPSEKQSFRTASKNGGRPGSPSPYYSLGNLDKLDDPLAGGRDAVMTRSAATPPLTSGVAVGRYGGGPSHSALSDSAATMDLGGTRTQPSFYGVKNHRKSLVDEDPNDVNVTTNEHFNLGSSLMNQNSSSLPGWSASSIPQRQHSTPPYATLEPPDAISPSPRRHVSGNDVSSARRDQRRQERTSRRVRSGDLPGSSHRNDSSHRPGSSHRSTTTTSAVSSSPPTVPTEPTSRPLTNMATPNRSHLAVHSTSEVHRMNDDGANSASRMPSVVAVGAGDDVKAAKANSKALFDLARQKDIDGKIVREMLENCKQDQEKLQLKLNNALEEADAIDNLEELFAVNDGICSAINAAHEALKKEKERTKKKKPMEGPTIEVLVENEDVFSLICMLRAPNEKRVLAALALMKFARENEILRNEIRSSGGMHSFLTLFRTKGTTKELQVVASMAVAYVLPSFVVSSQTSSSVGLRIVECLRFLVTAKPVTPQNTVITRDEMVKAASVGVNVLWINAIQPLLAIESAKAESKQNRPALRPSASIKFGRMRGRTGSGVFDQGQESIEIRELTELAVSLIAHLAHLSDNPGEMNLDIGYNIVEQVCEVDAARPIAVREGLLKILVDWIRSKQVDKVRPAASALRYLISIKDSYMAGWIHSQVVNEGAIGEIVKLLNESVGHDVRVAVAQMISALCVAPHTRAAVVEARCVSYLVALLYEHTSPTSEEMVRYAAYALLQLAAGAMIRAAASSSGNSLLIDGATQDDQETVITEIIEGWAHGSFVQIAMDHEGKLRSVSVEALRVLSEDISPLRQTRLQLCGAGAGEALGKTLQSDKAAIEPLLQPEHYGMFITDPESSLFSSVKDVHEALRGLANILEPQKRSSRAKQERRLSGVHRLDPREMLIKGCLDVVKSGGLDCLFWISSLPYSQSAISDNPHVFSADRMDLLDEACRLMANLSPLLLSDEAASNGCTQWASDIFEALHGILARVEEKDDEGSADNNVEIMIDALRGLGALAGYEPLKIRIVDKSLPKLLSLKTLSGERNDLSNAASQVLLSLGFTEDEITVQVAGNNPKLLVDWFCLQRALLLQAMARTELRNKVVAIWQLPFSDLDSQNPMKLARQMSVESNLSSQSADDQSIDSQENLIFQTLFENFTRDSDSLQTREAVLQQYRHVYIGESSRRGNEYLLDQSVQYTQGKRGDESSLMTPHVFPLNDTTAEKDWILSHHRVMQADMHNERDVCAVGVIPDRIERLLDCCFPSKLVRNDIVPVNDLRPQSSFNFRALMMPQRRYFSFRREGQLLARLCEKQAGLSDTDEVHWSLGFTNSTFAGEFVESLVQSLYLCPMIIGLSFARNADWLTIREGDSDCDSDEGGGLLANLAGSLPPWVSHLTFDNVLNDRDLRALVAIIDTMGKLSFGMEDDMSQGSTPSVGQSQGKFSSLAIRNSPQVSRDSWNSLFNMLGKSGPAKRGPNSMPMSSLTVLDLSGNKMGDELAALILELVHDKDSGCNLEQLDLSGNRIGRGTNVVRVLRSYTEYYRYNQQMGVRLVRSGWKSSLHTLILAENDLFLGQAGLEIFSLLKHNALCLRVLDLSNNGLEGDTYQLLTSAILKNTSLSHLNLSGNKFSSPLIDLILEHITMDDAESGLSFLFFENNSPALNPHQRNQLARFLRKSRKNALDRFSKERKNGNFGESAVHSEQSDRHDGLELIDETSTNIFRSSFSAHRQRLLPDEIETSMHDEGDNMITVLFSAPLVFADEENKLHPFAKLDFDMERELLWQCMKEASRDIGVSFDNAHHSRLLATLTKRCSCLHYSGHGHPHFLPFEDGMGGPNWLNVQDIKELILRDGAAPFKFVFVSACHSGLAGETFASAGVPHVVCCQQEQELKDTAALAFTRSFYLALAVGHTVKESFEQGCKAVRATPNLKDPEKEMEKFVLLPKDGNHNVPVFKAKPVREWPKQPRNQALVASKSKRRGSLLRSRSVMALGAKGTELSTRNMMQDDPSPAPPQFFVGREVDMYYMLTALLKMKKRLVNVLGEPGIGRSSLVCALCHYINERASTITEIQRIYFIKPKHGGRNVSCRSLLRQLLDKLEEAGKCRPTEEDSDTEAMLDIISRSLKNEKALIVFDRTELLEKSDDAQELPMILSTLLYDTKQVKVILTGRHPLGQPSIGGQVEHPFNLGPVNFANSVRLFANLCPHLHTPSERGLFVSELIGAFEESAQLFPGDKKMSDQARSILASLGDGIPAKIEKAAYSISLADLNALRKR